MGVDLDPLQQDLKRELSSFQDLWSGGYFVGDPLDPVGWSDYGPMGYMSILHAVYLTCIKPHVTRDSVVLEIGPGRGAWTKTFLPAKEVWCLDALSAEHNAFWDYVGKSPNVRYFQVPDFSCSMLPDDRFDYLFSFGAFCHISFEGIRTYLKNLNPKLRHGAHGFIMIADYDKYNFATDHSDRLNVFSPFTQLKKHRMVKLLARVFWKMAKYRSGPQKHLNVDESTEPKPGRWYHAGIERTCGLLTELGYEVVDPDVGAVHRDPIIHFKK